MQPPSPARPLLPYALATIAIAALALGLVASTLSSAPYEALSDDGYYLRFGQTIGEHGLSAFPRLFEDWNGTSANWICPSPLRIGFICVSALWFKVFGASLESLSWLSTAAHVVWILVTAFFARRHLEEARALLVTALAAFAPLLLGTARLALQDSFLLVPLALSFWTFVETLAAPRSRGWRAAFVGSFALAILTKELAVLCAPAFALGWLLERRGRSQELPLAPFAWQMLLPAALVAPLYPLAAGGFGPLFETIGHVLSSPDTNAYAVRFGSGPWYRYLIDFLCLSPVTTLLALAFTGVLLARLRREPPSRLELQLGILAAVLLLEMSFFTKNVRYLMILELPLVVFASGMLCELVPRAVRARWLWIGAAGLYLCYRGWLTFEYCWVQHGIYDPLSGLLFQMREILPPPGR